VNGLIKIAEKAEENMVEKEEGNTAEKEKQNKTHQLR